jgi:hypothetical protein
MGAARNTRALGLVAAAFLVLGAVRCAYSPDFPNGTLKCSVNEHSCPEGYACDSKSDTCFKNGQGPSTGAGTGGHAGAAGATGVAGAAGSTGVAGTGGHGGAAGATGVAGAAGSTGIAGATGQGGSSGAGGAQGPPCAGTCTIKIDGLMVNSATASPDSKFVGHWVYQTGSTEMVACSDGSDKTNDLTGDYVDITLVSSTPTVTLDGSYFCDWNLAIGPQGNATIIKPNQSCSRNVTDAKTGVTHFTWHGTTFVFRTDDGKTGTLNSMIGVDYIDDPSKTGCSQ